MQPCARATHATRVQRSSKPFTSSIALRNVVSKPVTCHSISSAAQLASSSSSTTHHQQQQQQCQHHPHHHSSSSRSRSRCGLVVAAAAGKGFGNPAKTTTKGSSKGKRRCPCGSGQSYEACCARYHSGAASAPTPEALLRSRFSAYALQEVDYLVASTHRQNPEYTGSAKSYAKALRSTAAAVEYLQLTVGGPVEVQDLPAAYRNTLTNTNTSSSTAQQTAAAAAAADGEDAFLKFSVKFRPREGGGEQVVNEISHFRKVDGQWLYFNEVDV